MDANHFDELVKRVAGPSRRTLLGTALAGLAALFATTSIGAERRKPKKRTRKQRKHVQAKKDRKKDLRKKDLKKASQRPADPPPGAAAQAERPCEHGRPCGGGTCCPGEKCRDGLCVPNQNASCIAVGCPESTGNPCTGYVCNRTGGECEIVPLADGTLCDDGDACTGNESCQAGVCTPGSWTECWTLADPCQVNLCDPASGECRPENVPNGTPCEDGNLCTVGDSCQNGACQAGAAKNCDPTGNSCHVARCNRNTGNCEGRRPPRIGKFCPRGNLLAAPCCPFFGPIAFPGGPPGTNAPATQTGFGKPQIPRGILPKTPQKLAPQAGFSPRVGEKKFGVWGHPGGISFQKG